MNSAACHLPPSLTSQKNGEELSQMPITEASIRHGTKFPCSTTNSVMHPAGEMRLAGVVGWEKRNELRS